MRTLRPPNCTFDFYILPNVPPAAPDITSSGYLHTWFFPGMQINKGETTFFFDSALDILVTDEEYDPWPNAPGAYRIYIPDKMHQGYDVIYIEHFRSPPYYGRGVGVDFKRIFLKRRWWNEQGGLFAETNGVSFKLAGTSGVGRPIGATGGVRLAGAASYLNLVKASGGLQLGDTTLVLRPISANGGLTLGSVALVLRAIAAVAGSSLKLGSSAAALRPVTAVTGSSLTLGSSATRVGGNTQSFLTNTTFTVPSYFTPGGNIKISVSGTGGNGAAGGATNGGGGGGAGGYSVTSIAANPGDVITIKFNDSGTCWASNTGSRPTTSAHGALANNGSTAASGTGAAGGSTTGAIGTSTFPGGSGGSSSGAATGGGGGGGAGVTHNNGSNASGPNGGAGGVGTLGTGGAGGTSSAGHNATGRACGGGGGSQGNPAGLGVGGSVIITW